MVDGTEQSTEQLCLLECYSIIRLSLRFSSLFCRGCSSNCVESTSKCRDYSISNSECSSSPHNSLCGSQVVRIPPTEHKINFVNQLLFSPVDYFTLKQLFQCVTSKLFSSTEIPFYSIKFAKETLEFTGLFFSNQSLASER